MARIRTPLSATVAAVVIVSGGALSINAKGPTCKPYISSGVATPIRARVTCPSTAASIFVGVDVHGRDVPVQAGRNACTGKAFCQAGIASQFPGGCDFILVRWHAEALPAPWWKPWDHTARGATVTDCDKPR